MMISDVCLTKISSVHINDEVVDLPTHTTSWKIPVPGIGEDAVQLDTDGNSLTSSLDEFRDGNTAALRIGTVLFLSVPAIESARKTQWNFA
jgi:hypothetical protein